jgi:hypothetical protein
MEVVNDIKDFKKLLSNNRNSTKAIEEILKWYDYH